jgi:hypothetical protein
MFSAEASVSGTELPLVTSRSRSGLCSGIIYSLILMAVGNVSGVPLEERFISVFPDNKAKFLGTLALFLHEGVAHADERNTPSFRMSELFLDRCVPSILDDQLINGDGLNPLPRETALSIGATTGRAWMPFDAHVSLSDFQSSEGGLYGCQVRWHPLAAQGRGAPINYGQVIDAFNTWADVEISQGTLAAIEQCGDQRSKYLRVVESRTERSQPVRFVISYDSNIDFIFLMAGETDVQGGAETC